MIKPNHTALYFFAIEHCNRLGWKEKFGFPTTMAMEAIGIKSYNTYINTLNDLVEYGFIKMIEKSKNQYSANIIALSNNDKALNKALDKALIKHSTKQSESTVQSIDSIDKQETKKQVNKKQRTNTIPETSSGKKQTHPLFNPFKEVFINGYLQISDTDYYWNVKDSVALNKLIGQITHAYKSVGNENPTESDMINGFAGIINKALNDEWVRANFEPSIISSKFNNLKLKRNGKRSKADERFDKIANLGRNIKD